MGRCRSVLLCGLTAALLVATPARAQTTAPVIVDNAIDGQFAEPDGSALSVGASDGGDAVAAWRDAGGSVSAVKLLLWRAGAAKPEVTVPGLGTTPSVAMAANGHAVAAWTGSDGKPRIASRAPGGSFAAPAVIAAPVSESYASVWGAPSIAIRSDGSAVMAVPSCINFGASAQVASRAFDVTAAGVISAPSDPQTYVSAMGCSSMGATRVAVGAGGKAALTFCTTPYCMVATRPAAGVWAPKGVDGSTFAPNAAGAVPVLTSAGSTTVTWRLDSSAPARAMAAHGAAANTLTQMGAASDPAAVSTAPDLTAFGTDALAVWQTATAGGQKVIARPIFSNGTFGAASTVTPLTTQISPPYADPRVASWPDGTSVVAFANQSSVGAAPSLALQRRSIGGVFTSMSATPSPARTVTSPRLALAGDGSAPLGIVATHEAPAPPAKATIVLRRIDGVAPLITLSAPQSAASGARVSLAASVTDVSAPVTVAWDFGDGEVGLGSDVQHVFAAPGTRTVTASATDAAGNVRTASATILVTAPNGPGGPGGPGTPSVDAAAPVISGATLAAKRFRIGKATTALAAAAQRAPKGTALKLTLSEQATLQILVVRRQPGRRAKGQCKASVKKGARCTLRATRATLQRALPAGGASIPFSGRLASGRLPAGTYELVLVATDPSGNRSAPVTLGFSIVR